MKKVFSNLVAILLSFIVVMGVVEPSHVKASDNFDTLQECSSSYLDETNCDELLFLSDEEIELLGGSEEVAYDPSGLTESVHITREDFASDEEYEQYLNDTTYMSTFAVWLIPPALAVVTRVGGRLVVRQTLKNSTKNIVIRNGSLANSIHPVTKVRFNANGFPNFSSLIQLELPSALIKSSNAVQFRNLNQQLLVRIQSNATFRSKFTSAQINQIKNSQTPSGYTWHHHQNTGVMQLVKSSIHQQTGHTGGRAIWGSL